MTQGAAAVVAELKQHRNNMVQEKCNSCGAVGAAACSLAVEEAESGCLCVGWIPCKAEEKLGETSADWSCSSNRELIRA